MASPFSNEERRILDRIRDSEESRHSYQAWVDRDQEQVNNLELSLKFKRESLNGNLKRVKEIDEALFDLRESLRKLFIPSMIKELETKESKVFLHEDSLDSLESRPNMEKSKCQMSQ